MFSKKFKKIGLKIAYYRKRKALKQMDGWVKESVLDKAVVYAGKLENTAGEIKLLNYTHLDDVLA